MGELWPGGPLTLPHTFTHDGVEVTVPELPTPTLLHWLGTGQWWQLYPNAVDPDQTEPLRQRLFDPTDQLDLVHLHDVAIRLFGKLTGMAPPDGTGWWPAVRLANATLAQWPLFHSWCVGHSVDPLHSSLMTTVTAAYAWLRDGLNRDQLAKFEHMLWEIPTIAAAPNAEPTEIPEHVRQEEAGAFLAAMGENLPGQQVAQGIF